MRLFRAFPIIVAGLLAAAGATPASAALVGVSNQTAFDAMKEYNVFATGGVTSSNHMGGRVFTGGSFTGNGFNLNSSNVPTGYGSKAITAVGNITANSGSSINGSLQSAGIVAGGTVTGTFNNNSGGATQYNGNVNNSFYQTLNQQKTDITASLGNLANNLKALATTNASFNPNMNFEGITTTGTGLAVMNLTESMFENVNSGREFKINTSAGQTLVINVAGKNINFDGTVNFNGDTAKYSNVLWNFYEAETVNIGRQFSGSILAAAMLNNGSQGVTVGNSGNIDGGIYSSGFVTQNANGQIHNVYFQGDLSSVGGGGPITAPEPATWGMMLLGFGLIGAAMRRRGQRNLTPQKA